MDKYTFQIVIQDNYTKPPKTTLVIDSQTFQMELLSRTGTKPYTYTFSKKLSLENGDYTYHYEIGNVWTLLISDDYFLNVSFMPKTTDLTIYAGNSKLNTWNIQLTDNILPNAAEISFESNSLISKPVIQVVMNADKMRKYSFRITSIQNTEKGYQYSAVSSANLNKTISTSVTAIKSIDLAKSILNAPIHGDLPEYIYLQQYENTTVSDILQKLLIINGARGYERNGRFFLKRDNNVKLKLTRLDKTVKWIEDRKRIRNDIKEFYSIKQYPVVVNSLTSYDASNWTGTVANVLTTASGLVSPNGNSYILKGNGTITRDVDFKITDFDHFKVSWSPPTASTALTIKLLTDSSNYLSYTRSFAGSQGAGFVLTSTNQSDEVVKTLTFTSKLIHSVQGKTSDACSVKVILKLSGSTVSETDWKNTVSNEFTFTFDNQEADTMEIHFKNLYVINTTYGVNCQNLSITEYVKVVSSSQAFRQETWNNVIDAWNFPFPGDNAGGNRGTVIHFRLDNYALFAVPPLSAGEDFNASGYITIPTKSANGYGSPYYNTQIYLPLNIAIVKGKVVISLSSDYTVSRYYESYMGEKCHLYMRGSKIKTTVKVSYVWKYKDYAWQSSYPMWDSVDIPISQFSKTGAPVNIAQIQLTATGDNYYDNIYLYASKPNAYYVEVEDENSINKYGRRFDLRKLDGWTSKESATLFATKYLDIFKKPSFDYRKEVPIKTPVELGDSVDCDGNSLYVYRILYDWESGRKTIYVGINVRELVERLKQMAQKIDNLEKNIM